MTGRKGTPLLLLVSALLAAALLVACGSSESDAGSDQFRDQTKSAILDFGEEGSEESLAEATEAVEDFLLLRDEEDWTGACDQLSRELLDKIEQLATSSTELEDKSCPSFLAAFIRLSPQEQEKNRIVDAGSLRERGERAFLVYHGGDEVVYAMPLSHEGGEWMIGSLAPRQLS